MRETLTELYINRVEWHLMDEYDVYVSFDEGGTDEYWFDPDNFEEDKGVITIDSTKTHEHQLHTLLHEAGHVSLRVKPDKFRSSFPLPARDTLVGRLEILREEVLAWGRAEYIAECLEIPVDKKEWKKSYLKALEKYAKWTSEEILYEKD